MPESKDMRQVTVDLSKEKPVFADEVIVASRIKAIKNEKKIEKEGNIELIFLDQLSSPPRAVSRVVVSKSTAHGLLKILNENLEKMEKDLKDKSLPKPQKIELPLKQDKGYLG